jgi:hypothetical protein
VFLGTNDPHGVVLKASRQELVKKPGQALESVAAEFCPKF